MRLQYPWSEVGCVSFADQGRCALRDDVWRRLGKVLVVVGLLQYYYASTTADLTTTSGRLCEGVFGIRMW